MFPGRSGLPPDVRTSAWVAARVATDTAEVAINQFAVEQRRQTANLVDRHRAPEPMDVVQVILKPEVFARQVAQIRRSGHPAHVFLWAESAQKHHRFVVKQHPCGHEFAAMYSRFFPTGHWMRMR